MKVRELPIPGALVFEPEIFPDTRGQFIAPFQQERFITAVGHPLTISQTNLSATVRGAVRGVHFTDVPPGQAKYVYAASGVLLDIVIDLRIGSPTFAQHATVQLDSGLGTAVYLPEGLGHAVLALSDNATIAYLCSTGYNPSIDRAITPLDPELQLPWPSEYELIISEKDRQAPTLSQALASNVLPIWNG
ncbi:MAG: dTDP-4-dehydrorhamnose 3,5-epimerase family protein [Mycobacteriaceae bacterium]